MVTSIKQIFQYQNRYYCQYHKNREALTSVKISVTVSLYRIAGNLRRVLFSKVSKLFKHFRFIFSKYLATYLFFHYKQFRSDGASEIFQAYIEPSKGETIESVLPEPDGLAHSMLSSATEATGKQCCS